jgi:hypothetical protein
MIVIIKKKKNIETNFLDISATVLTIFMKRASPRELYNINGVLRCCFEHFIATHPSGVLIPISEQ